MNISLWVPKGTNVDKERNFLRNELAESRNIQSKETRNAVVSGL